MSSVSCFQGILGDELTFDGLMEMAEADIRTLLKHHGASDHDIHTLKTALENLKLCTG